MNIIISKPFANPNGVTIKELKEILSGLPDDNEHGEPYEIWIGNEIGESNQLKSVWALNKDHQGCDVALNIF